MKLHLTKKTRFAFLVVFYLTHNLLIGQTQRAANQPSQTSTLQQRNSELSQNSNTENQSPFEAMKGKREDLKKRDLYSKHYINGDGSFTALIGAGPIHYEKNGQFLDINHTIEPQMDVQFPYANTTNLFSSHFGATAHTGVKNKTVEGEITEFLNTKMYWEVNGQAVNTVQSANQPVRIAGDKAYYDNLYGSIAAEFTTLTGKRKLNYIIPNQQALGTIPTNADFLVFSEDVVLPFGWTYSNTEGGISIRNQFGTEIYLYDNPTSTDANSEGLFNEENTVFETLLIGNTLTIKTKVKTSWLLSSERVYPIMVDPTVNVTPNNATRWTRSVYSNGTEVTSGTLYFGYQSLLFLQAHLRFNTSSIEAGSIINSATGYINITAGTGTSPASRQWQFANSANPVTTTNSTLYNSANLGYSNIVTVTGTGWRNSTLYNPQGNLYLENQLNNGAVNLTIYPFGTYNNNTYMTVANHTVSNRPYLVINYFHALTVTNAYTGANPDNGRHGYETNSNVSLYSGERPGYVCVGWEGTGNVPSVGTSNTVNIIMTQNSSINWLWEVQTGTPKNITFYNYGGDEQLTFNNSRIDTTTPTFRMSHQDYDATDYQVEINSNATFTGTSWTQTFTGAYLVNSEANFAFNNNFTPINNTTYYVRARVKGAANVWSAWTTETYSFTYQTPKETPDWFQTTQAQFQTDELSGTQANATNNVVTMIQGNIIQNGSFETNLNNWTKSSNWGDWYVAERDDYWSTAGNYCMVLYNKAPGTYGYSEGDYISMYQNVNLTGVSNLLLDANYESSSGNVRFRIIVADEGQEGGITGTEIYTWTPPSGNTTVPINVDLTPLGFTGNKIIKLVYYVYNGGFTTNFRYLSIDNVRTVSPTAGTITSTPIHLASVQDATGYQAVKWNQTLNSGEMTLKIQHSADGETAWTDAPAPFNSISATGVGDQSYDISSMTAYPHIRLVGNLNGENVTLHDWAVEFMKEEDDCPTTTTWDGTNWSNGIPDELTKRIIFDGNFSSADSNTISGNLTGCTLEVVSGNVVINSGHSVTLDNEIIITGGTFTLENDASLVQNNDVVNSGSIKVKRNTTNMVKFDATYWSSPVAGQNLKGFSPGTLNNRFYIYNGYNAAPTGISQHFKAVFVNDANYPMPNPIPAEWEVPASELNGNLFKMDAYTFKPGWGYSIRVPNNWPHALGTEGDVLSEEFDGVPHNGEVIVPAYGKYTMVGNPYPSPIQTMGPQGFFKANENVGTLHFWTHHFDVTELPEYNTNYVTYTSLGSAGNQPGVTGEPIPNGNIAVAQGFVVENSSIAEEQSTQKWDVIFRNEMRTKESGIFFKGNHDEGDRHRYWINLTNESDVQLAQILVGYTPEATYEVDHQIDGRRMGTAPLFSWIGENDYTVQGRPMPFEIEDIVPLGFVAHRDGKYKLSLHAFDGFFSDEIVRIYIRDNQTQEEHDLMSSDYWFEAVEGEYPNRFEIFYIVEEVLSNEEFDLNSIQIYHEGANIMVKSSRERILSVELWDISGRKLHQNQKVNSHLYFIPKSNFGTQVLLVTVMTEKGEITRKKIINY